MKSAVIGIGSNSVRMLMAEINDDGIRRLGRDREAPRLFDGLDAQGNLTEMAMTSTAGAVARMAEKARAAGCESIHVFATSAARDARNGEAFLEMLRQGTGTDTEIITGVQEAVLSFWGAEAALPGHPRCGMIDIGGGSTEVVIGRLPEPEIAFSCQMGAVRLWRVYPMNGEADLRPVEEMARGVLREQWAPYRATRVPESWVGTGGTFTALATLLRGGSWEDRRQVHGFLLQRDRVREECRRLAGMTLAQRRALTSLPPAKADIMVHGICILLAVMEELGIPEIRVSEYGNLDGYLRRQFAPEEGSPEKGAAPA